MRPGDLEPQPRYRDRLAVLVRRQPAPGPILPVSAERRREHLNATRAVPRPAIERALSRRDLPLREKTLWRMLYETAARASEVLALNIEDLVIRQCQSADAGLERLAARPGQSAPARWPEPGS